jgi:hypothetical protein
MVKFIQSKLKYLVITGLFSLLAICYFQQKELTKLRKANFEFIQGGDIAKAEITDSLQHLVDSLGNELFPKEIELGRYEVAFRIFLERNPKAAEQYAEIISSETE